MSDKFLNNTGLSYYTTKFKNWVTNALSSKMDKVTNATQYNVPQFDSNGQVSDSGVSMNDRAALRPTVTSSTNFSVYAEQYIGSQDYQSMGFSTADGESVTLETYSGSSSRGFVVIPSKTYVDGKVAQATENKLGTIKLNPSQNIDVDADGKLTVGGRIGQFPTTTGLFAPNNRDPRNVGNYSFLITDALGVDMSANRSMAVVSGLGQTCKRAAAGATEYRISNTYANRLACKMAEGGYASRDEATSTAEQIVPIVSVTINGVAFTPDSSANNTSNDIVITTAETLNPDSTITSIRLFGKMDSYATMHAGNGIKSGGGGRNLLLGGGVCKYGSGNDNCLVGNSIYSSGNGNACFGRYHIAAKNRGLFAGTGHDSTSAPAEGASALGQYSSMDSGTLFAVGNGSDHVNRSNAFEVRNTGGIVLKSPNGTRFEIKVDDSGNITATAL